MQEDAEFHLDLRCSNPKDVWGRGFAEEDREAVSFKVAKGRGHFNQLKQLRLHINHDAVAPLFLDGYFFKDSSLESIVIRVESWAITDSPITDLQSLQQLLLSSSSSLQYLDLSGMKLNAGITEGLQLHHLVNLSIAGNVTLIDFFLDVGYASLKELRLKLGNGEGKASEVIGHCKIIQILKCCHSTLEEITISVQHRASTSLEMAKDSLDNRQSPLTLPQLSYLKLDVEDKMIIEHYLPIDYPNLSRVWLRPSSKFSQANFSLKRQDSTLG